MLSTVTSEVVRVKGKRKAIRDMYVGMVGAGLWMVAQWMRGAYGEGNVRNGIIESAWASMSALRFEISIAVAAVAMLMLYIGLRSMTKALKVTVRRAGYEAKRAVRIFDTGASLGCVTFLFSHGSMCVIPMLYKFLFNTSLMSADIINVVESIYYYVALPMWISLILANVLVSLSFVYLVLMGDVRVPKLMIIMNPLVFMGLGELLKLTGVYYLVDFAAASVALGYLVMLGCGVSHTNRMPSVKKKRTNR